MRETGQLLAAAAARIARGVTKSPVVWRWDAEHVPVVLQRSGERSAPDRGFRTIALSMMSLSGKCLHELCRDPARTVSRGGAMGQSAMSRSGTARQRSMHERSMHGRVFQRRTLGGNAKRGGGSTKPEFLGGWGSESWWQETPLLNGSTIQCLQATSTHSRAKHVQRTMPPFLPAANSPP